MSQLIRGRVYAAEMSHIDGQKYFLIVSNNRRNRALPSVLAVRLTTTRKSDIPSRVELGSAEVLTGYVVCDDIVELWPDEVRRDMGALSGNAMAAVGKGLAAALALTDYH